MPHSPEFADDARRWTKAFWISTAVLPIVAGAVVATRGISTPVPGLWAMPAAAAAMLYFHRDNGILPARTSFIFATAWVLTWQLLFELSVGTTFWESLHRSSSLYAGSATTALGSSLLARRSQGDFSTPASLRRVCVIVLVGLTVTLALGPLPHVLAHPETWHQLIWTATRWLLYVGGTAICLPSILRRPIYREHPARPVLLAFQIALTGLLIWMILLHTGQQIGWVLLLPAVWIGITQSPRAAGVAVISAILLTGIWSVRPFSGMVHDVQLYYSGLLPQPTIVDMLMSCFALIAMALTLLRSQRDAVAAQLAEEREEARSEAELLSALIRETADGLLLINPLTWSLELHNNAAERILGRPLEEHRRDWADYLGVHDMQGNPISSERFQRFLGRQSGEATAIFTIRQPSGAVLSVEGTSVAFTESERRRVVVLLRDITHEMERVDSLRRFAGIAAHDMRGPLAGVRGWLDLASEALEEGEDPRPSLDRARRVGERMSSVIDDWLSFSLTQEGALNPVPLDLDQTVQAAAAGYAAGVGGTPPRIHSATGVQVKADQVLLEQLLANLIGNSVKYARPDTPASIEVTAVDDRQARVTISVRDNGHGIPAGQENAIFEAFHRGEDDRSGGQPGSGMGLALCRLIVQRHGGRIEAIRNDADGSGAPGSTIRFSLPRASS